MALLHSRQRLGVRRPSGAFREKCKTELRLHFLFDSPQNHVSRFTFYPYPKKRAKPETPRVRIPNPERITSFSPAVAARNERLPWVIIKNPQP